MTPHDRATLVINETYADEFVKPHMTPPKVAQALADAGCLMPDLPEPIADEVGELEWGGIARWEPDGSLHVTDDLYGKTSPHYLRETALALLAAADYAERNQN